MPTSTIRMCRSPWVTDWLTDWQTAVRNDKVSLFSKLSVLCLNNSSSMLTKLLLLVARRPIMEGLVCKLVDCFVFNKDLVNNCQLLFSPFLQQKKVYHRQREDTYGVGDGAWQNIWVKMSFKRLISLQYFLWQRWEKEMGWVKMRNTQHFAPTILYSRLFPKNTFFDIVFVVFLFCIYFVFLYALFRLSRMIVFDRLCFSFLLLRININ